LIAFFERVSVKISKLLHRNLVARYCMLWYFLTYQWQCGPTSSGVQTSSSKSS